MEKTLKGNKTDETQVENLELSIERKLMTLYSLQQIDSQIDKIKIHTIEAFRNNECK